MNHNAGRTRFGWRQLRDRVRFLLSRYLVVSSAPLIAAQAVTALLGLGRNVLLTQSLSKADYGSLGYVMSWVSLIALATLPGLDTAVAQYVAKGHPDAIRLGLRRRMLLSATPMALLVAFGLWGTQFGLAPVAPALWLVTALFYPTAQVLALVGPVLGALKRFRSMAIFSIGQSLAFLLAAALGLWLWPGRQALGIILGQWLLLSLLHAIAWLRLRRPEGQAGPLDQDGRRQFFRYGTHMTALGALGQVGSRLGTLLLGTVVSLESLADYALAELFYEQLRALWSNYHSVSYPRMITLASPARWRQARRELRLITPVFAGLSALAGAVLTVAIPWFFSARYASSIAYVWILLLAFVCSVPGGFYEMFFRLEEAERPLYRMRLASNISAIVLPPALLLLCGPLGIPLGRAAANLLYSISGWILFRRQRPELSRQG